MENKTIVVVGGVAGGMSFATRYRRLNQDDHVIVLDKGPYVSFANCGLPYYVSGEIESRDSLIVTKKEMLQDRFQLDVRPNHEVIAIHPKTKKVTVRSEAKTFEIEYDTLVLSPGATPIQLNIPGEASRSGIFSLRNIPDVDAITDYIDTNKPKTALVIGAGFIGLEMAENLKHKGMQVTVVEKAPQVLPPLDFEMAMHAQHELERNDVRVVTGQSVAKFEGNDAYLEDGTHFNADLVIMAVGVMPDTKMLAEANIELGMRQGIVVDKQFKTSEEDIYAVGDAIIVSHQVNGKPALVPLASPANRQGRQLADILSGQAKEYRGSLGTAIVRIFDMTFASTGLNMRQVDADKVQEIHVLGKDHAGYFPNATDIQLKVIYDTQTETILGAQAFGQKGVDKRIDIIATAIKANMKVSDLQELEFTYAPPFGTAKDVVNLAGYYAENMIQGITETIQWHEIKKEQEKGTIFIDVRFDNERENGSIENAIHIPVDNLRCKMGQLDPSKNYVVYCHSGVRSYNAERMMKAAGFNVKNLDGSYALVAGLKDFL